MWEILYGVPGFLYCFLELQREYDNHENKTFKTNFAPVSITLTKDILAAGVVGYEKKRARKVDLAA